MAKYDEVIRFIEENKCNTSNIIQKRERLLIGTNSKESWQIRENRGLRESEISKCLW